MEMEPVAGKYNSLAAGARSGDRAAARDAAAPPKCRDCDFRVKDIK